MSDVATPDRALDLYFGVLHGAPGQSRDWRLFHELFIADAHLRTVLATEGGEHVGDWMIADFVEHARELYEPNGISQIETSRRLEIHGNTAHAWCEFQSRTSADRSGLVTSGIQSLQMIRLGGRWWITGVAVFLG